MRIWISKPALALLGLVGLALAACEAGPGIFAFLPNQDEAPASTEQRQPQLNALPRANMMRGQVVLVPPQGYCVDKTALQNNFAILARCDALGARSRYASSVGIITVAINRVGERVDLAALLPASLPEGTAIRARHDSADFSVAQVRGNAPSGVSDQYWRGLAQVGPYMMGLAIYGAPKSDVTNASGQRLLGALVQRTASASTDALNEPVSQGAEPTRAGGGFLAGLFGGARAEAAE